MILYGVAALAASVLAGTIIGEILGQLLGVDANVGGVGFGMILLIALTTWLRSKGKLPAPTEHGVLFWNAMYIPIVVAMAAIQNVYAARWRWSGRLGRRCDRHCRQPCHGAAAVENRCSVRASAGR